MTDEEIKKLAEQYGKNVTDKLDYDMSDTPDSDYKLEVACTTFAAEPVIKWLSERFCIVPKSKVKECYGFTQLEGIQQHEVVVAADAVAQTMKSLFGKEMFEEDTE